MFPYAKAELQTRLGSEMYAASFVSCEDAGMWLRRTGHGKQLAVLAPSGHPWLALFHGEAQGFSAGYALQLCPTDHVNAQALQTALPNLKPEPLGLVASAGCGDRLGLATPGHVRAFHAVLSQPGACPVMPIFAQQSVRELARTNRTAEDVLGDATWGAFEAGWKGAVGADADHLKTTEDIETYAAAGFSFYTIDPGAYVDSEADRAAPDAIQNKVAALCWRDLASSAADLRTGYEGRTFELEDWRIRLDSKSLWRAAAKYGNAIAHVARMYRHLAGKGIPFELEVSVDETETPTTHAEHIFIVSELRRLGVEWVSLAPRYVGRFEKGVDYIGDLKQIECDLAGHAAIARAFGPYKLSLHSGSDKFSIYPLIVFATRGQVHLKTAGTSLLEAQRVIAGVNPTFFRELYRFAYGRYLTDRASYHVSADLARVPDLDQVPDAELSALLDHFHVRQMLHVTFGSALLQFGPDIKATLRAHEAEHYAALEKHFVRHLEPFVRRDV